MAPQWSSRESWWGREPWELSTHGGDPTDGSLASHTHKLSVGCSKLDRKFKTDGFLLIAQRYTQSLGLFLSARMFAEGKPSAFRRKVCKPRKSSALQVSQRLSDTLWQYVLWPEGGSQLGAVHTNMLSIGLKSFTSESCFNPAKLQLKNPGCGWKVVSEKIPMNSYHTLFQREQARGMRREAENRKEREERREKREERREKREESRDQREESREQRAESREKRAESREQRRESREESARKGGGERREVERGARNEERGERREERGGEEERGVRRERRRERR